MAVQKGTQLDHEVAIDVHRQWPAPVGHRLLGEVQHGPESATIIVCRTPSSELAFFREEFIDELAEAQPGHHAAGVQSGTAFAGTHKTAVLNLNNQLSQADGCLCLGATDCFAEGASLVAAAGQILIVATVNMHVGAAKCSVAM